MYRDKETEASYTYLEKVIRHLDRPICLLGGWAVYLLVNPLFKAERGYPYLGENPPEGLSTAQGGAFQ